MSPLIQSAINISEGRRRGVINAIVRAAEGVPGVTVADWSADADHNRMVVTLLGGAEAIRAASLAIARLAVEQIDLREHVGAHPRIGAVDVVPVVPIRGISMAECAALSSEIARDFAANLGLPVYLYERSAAAGSRAALPDKRKGGFEGLFTAPLTGLRAPDYGPAEPHPTAGAVVVGARSPLVAYNINLSTAAVSPIGAVRPESPVSPEGVAVARRIAARIREKRESNPALAGVRAMGLWLPSRNLAQVSMNLTLPEMTPMPAVFDFVRQEATLLSANVVESEVIGLIPRSTLGGESPQRILWRHFQQTQLLDFWLERL